MNKALVLVKWPAMAATVKWAAQGQVSGQEAASAAKIDLNNDREKVVAQSCEGTERIYDCGSEGLWALLKAIGDRESSGLMVNAARIPVLQLTLRLAREAGESPYTADGTGCMVIVTTRGSELASTLCSLGIPASVIGKLTGLPGPVMVQTGAGLVVL